MNPRGPPYTGYPAPPQQQQAEWNAYYAQQQQLRPAPGPTPPLPQQAKPQPPNPEHANLYANYGYGSQWRPPPSNAQPLPPQQQPPSPYPPMPSAAQYPQGSYPPVAYHPHQMPVMYIQPGQPMMHPGPPMQQPMAMQMQMSQGPPLNQRQPMMQQQQFYSQPVPQNNNNNVQRFPPAKRPRFDNNNTSGPSSSFNNNSPNGLPRPPHPAPPTVGPPPVNAPQPPLPSTAAPPLPQQPPPGTNVSTQQSHGRFPPQQAPFRGRGGSNMTTRGRGANVRGGSAGRGGSMNSIGRTAGGRGGSHGPMRGGSFRGGHNNSFKPSVSSGPQGVPASSFNPQLPNGQALGSFSSTRHTRSNQQSFTHGGSSRRDDGGGAKKTLTDFRIIGVECPALHWAWGAIPSVINSSASSDEPVETVVASDNENEPTKLDANTDEPKLPVVQLAKLPNKPSISVTENTATAPANQNATGSSLPQLVKPANSIVRSTTETSRIRLYFNSPIELEEKAPNQAPEPTENHSRRGGKRKKEHDEGEPEEGGKRKKEDNDNDVRHHHLTPPSAPLRHNNGAQRMGAGEVLEPSGIGAKRKALSLSGDEDAPDQEPPESVSAQDEASTEDMDNEDNTETEYAGSPPPAIYFDDNDAPQSNFSAGVDGEDEIGIQPQAVTEMSAMDENQPESLLSERVQSEALDVVKIPGSRDVPQVQKQDPDSPSDPSNHEYTGMASSLPNISSILGDDAPPIVLAPGKASSDPGAHVSSPVPNTTAGIPNEAPEAEGHAIVPASPVAAPPVTPPSSNRISISYAGSSRRLVLDAEIVERVKIYRTSGKVEVRITLELLNPSRRVSATDAPSPEVTSSTGEETEVAAMINESDEIARTPPAEREERVGDSVLVEQPAKKGADSVAPEKKEPPADISESARSANSRTSQDVEGSVSNSGPRFLCRGILASSSVLSSSLRALKGLIRHGIPTYLTLFFCFLLSCLRSLYAVEVLSESSKDYIPAVFPPQAGDATLPDFSTLVKSGETSVDIIAYLDRDKPLSEPKWVRTGDVDDMLNSVFTKTNPEGRHAWANKVEVADPDPPPTLQTVLDSWATNSNIGVCKDRRRFVRDHMLTSVDHVLEILLRQVRGSTHHGGTGLGPAPSFPSLNNNSTLTASSSLSSITPSNSFSPNAPHAAQHAQSPMSLAFLGLYHMAAEFAERSGEPRSSVEDRLGQLIVRVLPQSLVYKSVDAIFRDWSGTVGLPVMSGMGGGTSSRKKLPQG